MSDRPRKRSPKSPKAAVGAMATSFRLAHGSARLTGMFAGAVLAATVTGIAVNALALQRGHHPAPFFGRSFAPPADVSASAAVPSPPVRPAAGGDATAAVRAQAAALPTPAVVPDMAKPANASAHDPIAQLIRGSAPARPTPAMTGHSGKAPHAASAGNAAM